MAQLLQTQLNKRIFDKRFKNNLKQVAKQFAVVATYLMHKALVTWQYAFETRVGGFCEDLSSNKALGINEITEITSSREPS